MPENNLPENKLQIRAKLLSAVINLQNNSNDGDYVQNTLDEMTLIENKAAVLEILTKEFLKENSELKDITITFLLRELIEEEQLEKHFFEALANPQIKDSLKTKIVGLLRAGGKHVNYEQYVNYFENPDEIIDADTTKLLENAKINPESQIDFMDFINALPDNEQLMLIESLKEDYDGDNLANILMPVILSNPYSELSLCAIKAVGESKSPLAFSALKCLDAEIQDLKVKSAIQKSLSLLRLSGAKQALTQDYYKELLSSSLVYKCYANYPDGHGNVGLIFSRKTEDGLIQMFAVVINDTDGVIDCFGFNEIRDSELERIVSKFFNNDRVVDIDAKFCKYLLLNAEKISRRKHEEISYEYIAWKSITNDIDYEDINLEANLEKSEITEFLLEKLYKNNYFEKWFFENRDNEEFSSLTNEILEQKIDKIEKINALVSEYKNKIFSPKTLKILNDRLILTAYLSMIDNEAGFSKLIFALADETEVKEVFLKDIVKKSVYEYFLSQKDKFYNTKTAASIFTKKAGKEIENMDIKFIERVIKEIEKNWA